ncbi:MAG: 3-deoxy-D-manno-octulosonic acid transferase [Phycisphaerae bacterium]|nr:3-deoxy-D-manno-octulosonic acid transferase [Phycisphaerae bacterium]
MRYLLDLAYMVAGILYLPFLMYRVFVTGKSRTGWAERFGGVKPRAGSDGCVWLHAVSVGEVNATRTLIEVIERRLPGLPVVISTTTDTGYARARQVYPDRQVFRYPLDFSWAVSRAIRRLRPAAIVLMELEIWPNMLEVARVHGVPVMVANGRITEQKSMRRFGKPVVRSIARRMFGKLACVGAQDETYAERFRMLGTPADRVHVTGTMKYDTAAVTDRVEGQEALVEELGIHRDEPLWVCGCTGPGEEAVVLEAYQRLLLETPALQLAIIPRKPERFDEAAGEIERRGLPFVRRSVCRGAPDGKEGVNVFLGDTMGELRQFYALGDVVFVGRTMTPLGGSDVLEVAGLAKAMIVGPSTYNFAEPVKALLAGGGIVQIDKMVDDAGADERLAGEVGRLLRDEGARREAGKSAREVLLANQGATERTVDLLCRLIEAGAS